jgi:hypothetical protein
VAKIDEEEPGMVTWGYATHSRYMVYNMELGPLWPSSQRSVR